MQTVYFITEDGNLSEAEVDFPRFGSFDDKLLPHMNNEHREKPSRLELEVSNLRFYQTGILRKALGTMLRRLNDVALEPDNLYKNVSLYLGDKVFFYDEGSEKNREDPLGGYFEKNKLPFNERYSLTNENNLHMIGVVHHYGAFEKNLSKAFLALSDVKMYLGGEHKAEFPFLGMNPKYFHAYREYK